MTSPAGLPGVGSAVPAESVPMRDGGLPPPVPNAPVGGLPEDVVDARIAAAVAAVRADVGDVDFDFVSLFEEGL